MSSEIAIKVENLTKCYQIYAKPQDRLKQSIYPRLHRFIGKQPKQYFNEFWALKDISFEVRRGESIGIIGRNGSGKSTLLQIICGTLNPTSGSVKTYGRVAALLELGSGFNPEFTGRENVYMNAVILGLTNEETDARFEEILTFADIGQFIDQPVKTYSSGMMLRLAFAVIAHVDADILVIDEALAVGDAFFSQKCMRFLRNFMKTSTVLFVSHDTSSIRSLCSKAIWIEKGSIVKQGKSKDVSESYLEAFYESQQGPSVESEATSVEVETPNGPEVALKDQRQELINASNLRNDIQLFAFDPKAPSFGKGGAKIVSVQLLNRDGKPLSWMVGGEDVILKIKSKAYSRLNSPIIGFIVNDHLGQALFADNTWLSYIDSPVFCREGELLEASFTFALPILAAGQYSISVAIANGSQLEHVQHHWVHDAIVFKSESTSVSTGKMGIPMKKIKLTIEG